MESTLITIIALVVIGGIASIVLLVRAFQVNAWWGVASLTIPGAQFVFGLCYWSRAKYSFLITHLTLVGVFAAIIHQGIPLTAEGLSAAFAGSPYAVYDDEELTSMIQEKRTEIERLEGQFDAMGSELTAQFAALNKKRTALKATDTAAVLQFNAEAAAYDAKNSAHKAISQQLESVRKELQDLLDERTSRIPKQQPCDT